VSQRIGVTAPRALRLALVNQAVRESPRECCGLLLGSGNRIQFAVPAPNRAAGRTRFRLDPRLHLDVQRTVRRFTPPLDIVGAYHSHPAGPARPSERDVAEAHYPNWVHLIVGLGAPRPRVSAFRIARGRASAIRLRWV